MSASVVSALELLMARKIPKLNDFHISWFGGEPLLEFDMVHRLTNIAASLCSDYRVNFSSNMTTNGSLLFLDRARLLISSGVTEYQITLDGTADTHNKSRVGRHGSDTFSDVLANLLALKDLVEKFEVIVRVNVDSDNLTAIPQLLDTLSSSLSGDARFKLLFRRVGEWGGENDHNLNILNERSALVDFAGLREKALSQGLSISGGLLQTCKAGDGVCYAARPYSFIVGSDGRLMKCTVKLDGMPENVVGHLANDGTLQIDDARMRRWIEPAYRVDKGCQSCQLLPNCQGMHCPLIRIRDEKACCPENKSELRQTLLETMV